MRFASRHGQNAEGHFYSSHLLFQRLASLGTDTVPLLQLYSVLMGSLRCRQFLQLYYLSDRVQFNSRYLSNVAAFPYMPWPILCGNYCVHPFPFPRREV